ncbi:MAG: nucleoid-associated protein [Chitinophagales bacterium]
MLDFSAITFKSLAVHRVGNKMKEEGILLSQQNYRLADEEFRNILLDYFLKPFKNDEFYAFTHENLLTDNEVYNSCKKIFSNKHTLLEESGHLAKALYGVSNHPKIQGGEFYVAYFADCQIDDEMIDAIGIFKSENKYLYLKPEEQSDQMVLKYEQGINTKKLDKGCLIFNTSELEGYRILIVDKQSRGSDEVAQYWKQDFLSLIRVHDNSFNTATYLQMCQLFCEDELADEKDRKDQVLLLTKSLNYFTEHDVFNVEEFNEEVLEQPEMKKQFKSFQKEFESDYGFSAEDDFKISTSMVKSMKRYFKKNIELDTDIHIRLNSEETEQYIERGFDEQRGMYFYKVFFREEN